MSEEQVKKEMAIYEAACLAYARNARKMRHGECDRRAMAAAFLTIRNNLLGATVH